MKKIVLFNIVYLTSLLSFSQEIKLVFRYDDFVFKKDTFNERLVEIFKKHNLPLVLGVIPADQKEKLILENGYAYLSMLDKKSRTGEIEIALHGLNHYKIKEGEFQGVSTKEQNRRIFKGKFLLDSLFQQSIVTFIPPWNAYDKYTLSALERYGFKNISSALVSNQSTENPTINYYPCTIEHPSDLLPTLRSNKDRDAIIVLMFHRYNFGKSFTLSDLEDILINLKKTNNLKCYTFRQLFELHENGTNSRFKANLESNFLTKYLKITGALQTYNYVLSVRIINVLIYLAFGFIIFLITTQNVFRDNKNSKKINWIMVVLLTLILSLSVWFHLLSPNKLFLFSGLIVFIVCLVLRFLKKMIYPKHPL